MSRLAALMVVVNVVKKYLKSTICLQVKVEKSWWFGLNWRSRSAHDDRLVPRLNVVAHFVILLVLECSMFCYCSYGQHVGTNCKYSAALLTKLHKLVGWFRLVVCDISDVGQLFLDCVATCCKLSQLQVTGLRVTGLKGHWSKGSLVWNVTNVWNRNIVCCVC